MKLSDGEKLILLPPALKARHPSSSLPSIQPTVLSPSAVPGAVV